MNLYQILNILKNNQVCLKDFIDTLSQQIADLSDISQVNVNLKCYANFDNQGNSLQITRDQLDQLVIDQLCSHEDRLDTIEGTLINIQEQINDLSNDTTVSELNISTCVDPVIKPTSSQVISVANAHCDLEDATGTSADISTALSNTPSEFSDPYYVAKPNWIVSPGNLADNYNNLLIAFQDLLDRVTFMENNCCAVTCDEVKVNFSAFFNEDNDGIILSFTSGSGTNIPSGFIDIGSTIVITDIDGNVEQFNTSAPNLIANNAQIEIPITLLNRRGDLTINVTPVISNGTLTCQKCITKILKVSGSCDFCTITNTGTEGAIVIIYEANYQVIATIPTSTTTTTTSGS